jgi:hypothetical protein
LKWAIRVEQINLDLFDERDEGISVNETNKCRWLNEYQNRLSLSVDQSEEINNVKRDESGRRKDQSWNLCLTE